MVVYYKGCFVLVFFLLAVVASGFYRNLPIVPFDEGYSHLFGHDNLVVHRDGESVHLSLDERTGLCFFFFFWVFAYFLFLVHVTVSEYDFYCVYTGSGFVSHDLYLHGFFSVSIKLPADYTAGVVVAFYVSHLFNSSSPPPKKKIIFFLLLVRLV